jgi:CheY-like chemotaxis protein
MVLVHSDLPGIDGYGVCRAIRDESRAPIVMVLPRIDDDSVLQRSTSRPLDPGRADAAAGAQRLSGVASR